MTWVVKGQSCVRTCLHAARQSQHPRKRLDRSDRLLLLLFLAKRLKILSCPLHITGEKVTENDPAGCILE